MRYLKKFENREEEGVVSFDADDYVDYLLSEVPESKISFIDKSKNLLYIIYEGYHNNKDGYSISNYDKLKKYLNSNLRFKDVIVLADWIDMYFQILIIDRFFYSQNQKYLIKNLRWEEHDLTKRFKSIDFGNIDPNAFKSISFPDGKRLQGTPPGISVIKNMSMSHSDQIELMLKNDEDPTYLNEDNDIGLQYFIFKALEIK